MWSGGGGEGGGELKRTIIATIIIIPSNMRASSLLLAHERVYLTFAPPLLFEQEKSLYKASLPSP